MKRDEAVHYYDDLIQTPLSTPKPAAEGHQLPDQEAGLRLPPENLRAWGLGVASFVNWASITGH